MSSVNSVRIPGLATGMDTDQMIKDMLTGEQNKVDGAKQKEQITKWQQESYRDIIKDVKGLYDKYFSATSKDFILSSKVFSTTVVNSSDSNIISASAGAGASNVNYKFEVTQLAQSPKMSSSKTIAKDTKISELGVTSDVNFKINFGDKKDSQVITIKPDDTVESLIKKINESSSGEIKASYSEMTGKFTIESKTSGENSALKIVDMKKDVDGKLVEDTTSNALSFLGISGSEVKGTDAIATVRYNSGDLVKNIKESSNTFTIDNITYTLKDITDTGKSVNLTSTKDTKSTVEKVQAFMDDYNKILEDIYDNVTEKKNKDYPPLTEAQKEDMSEEEIEKWEKKAKEGLLRNDKELRAFMDDIKKAIFAPVGELNLSDIGIQSDDDYNKQGQLKLNVDKFTKSLEDNGDLVYKTTTEAFGKIKDVTYKYAGSSSSIFVKKAGMDKTSTAINNLFSEQLRKQEEQIKNLTRKMQDKESSLYKKFATLETNMNRLNSQMSYLTSSMGM